ncbi:DNA polymerase III subunit alpha [Halalkalibacter sp. AB-rgal2]|uniref:DNA polymerase III subunit alpha n=1 Tax=Halalkalibacter sp. AB-rgal2 TaxID=3242695 RepID=UPI00359CF55F
MEVVPIHVLSEYSLLSSTNRIEELIQHAHVLGYKQLALTDKNVLYGAVPFYQACKKRGIKPIIGLDISVQVQADSVQNMRLYAKNNEGYKQLMLLSSRWHHKEREDRFLTKEEITSSMENVVIVIPFEYGPITNTVRNGDWNKAMIWLEEWIPKRAISHTFIEIHSNEGQNDQYLEHLQKISDQTGIRLIAAQPCHYLKKSDVNAYHVLRAIRDGKKLEETELLTQERHYYLKDPSEMAADFRGWEKALENTSQLAEMCNVEIELNKIQLPTYPTDRISADEQLEELCLQGCKQRYEYVTAAIEQRLKKELTVIYEMGYSDYFLIVWDFMRYAKENGMMTGPGRGSAAGSLVAYLLEITDVDPLQYDLLFERFLNPERVSMPDIDIDFPDHRRDEVIEYVQKKYGRDRVAHILTFGTLAARAVIRDVAKVLGVQAYMMNQLLKEIPVSPGMTLDKAWESSEKLKSLLAESVEAKRLWEIATQLEGLPRHTSTHAAGVVISAEPLTNVLALQAGTTNVSLTQATMDVVEQLGLLKFDFLGLRNLTLLERIVYYIEQQTGTWLDVERIPLNDRKTFQLLSDADTTGVFQLESNGMRRVLSSLQPTEFEDIVAVNALYRPGPMEYIQTYIKRKYKQEEVTYPHSDVKPLLEQTYGVLIYQEQIMQMASILAGFSLAEADLLRRAISKKKKNDLEEQRITFIQGAVRKGYSEDVAANVFSLIERFADYGFNRSHAVAYSLISYRLAYLKAHYPLPFYTALLSSAWNQQDKLYSFIQESREKGLDIRPPSLLKSEWLFSIEEQSIRFGLLPISHIGVQAAKEIMTIRNKKKINDLFQLTIELYPSLSKKALESLIKAGALDYMDEDRAVLLASVDDSIEFAQNVKEFQEETEGLFTLDMEAPLYQQVEPFTEHERLEFEKEVLGFYLSGHPLEKYGEKLASIGRVTIIEAFTKVGSVILAGKVESIKRIRTKKGDAMAFASVVDETGTINATFFPLVWSKVRDLLIEGEMYVLEGRTDFSQQRKSLVVERLYSVTTLKEKASQRLYLRIMNDADPERLNQLKRIMKQYPGDIPIILYYEKTNQTKYLSKEYLVNSSDACLHALYQLLGKDNVKIRP